MTTSRSLSGCLEMAQVHKMEESLYKKVEDSKVACRLVGEAGQAQVERQRDLENRLPMMQPFRSRSSDKENHSPCSSEHSERIKASPWDSGHLQFGFPSRASGASSSVALDLPSPSTPRVNEDSPLTPGILRYSGASTPAQLSEDRGSDAGSSHEDGWALRTDFKSWSGKHVADLLDFFDGDLTPRSHA
ncbi:hypothetical protein WJX74_008800 [Apatococcus lobatus]|uniref:Uncharacterized protein n=1 Tax=Apatococcus lobatus TaxID=904363 RepID=A0AAW1Q8M4_9CHLO